MSILKAIAFGTMVAALVTAGCDGESSAGGCTKDTDCKGDRVCQGGVCVGGEGGGGTGTTSSTSQTGTTTTSQGTGTDSMHCYVSQGDGACRCDLSGSGTDLHCDPAVFGPSKCCADSTWPNAGECACYTTSCQNYEGGSCNCVGGKSFGSSTTCNGPSCCVWKAYLQFDSYSCTCYPSSGVDCGDTYMAVPECTLENFKSLPCADGEVLVDKCN